MPCFHPLPAWYGHTRGASGKRPVVFNFALALKDRPTSVPCGRCAGCIAERARQWAVRCSHEALLHALNCFLTLTYDEAELAPNGSLVPAHMTLFLKRLRKHLGAKQIRYFQCGEYGETTYRPHHHVLLFGHSFDDARRLHLGSELLTSPTLERLWGHGLCSIGEVNFATASYVARYALKKNHHPPGTVQPYATMSRRPGLGSSFVVGRADQLARQDFVISEGHKVGLPRFYRNKLAQLPHLSTLVAAAGFKRRGRATVDRNATGKRLIVREEVKLSAQSQLKRDIK